MFGCSVTMIQAEIAWVAERNAKAASNLAGNIKIHPSDPREVAPDKLKTVLRQPVREAIGG